MRAITLLSSLMLFSPFATADHVFNDASLKEQLRVAMAKDTALGNPTPGLNGKPSQELIEASCAMLISKDSYNALTHRQQCFTRKGGDYAIKAIIRDFTFSSPELIRFQDATKTFGMHQDIERLLRRAGYVKQSALYPSHYIQQAVKMAQTRFADKEKSDFYTQQLLKITMSMMGCNSPRVIEKEIYQRCASYMPSYKRHYLKATNWQ